MEDFDERGVKWPHKKVALIAMLRLETLEDNDDILIERKRRREDIWIF